MNLTDLYCVSCAGNLLSAASYIAIHTANCPDVRFDERGYEAIVKLTQLLDDARAVDPNAWIQMNGQRLVCDLRAVTLVNGDAVCASHIWDAVERLRNGVRR